MENKRLRKEGTREKWGIRDLGFEKVGWEIELRQLKGLIESGEL